MRTPPPGISPPVPTVPTSPRRLIVTVPSLRRDATPWNALVERLRTEPGFDNLEYLYWDHKLTWHSVTTPTTIANELAAVIHQTWRAKGPFDDVILVGHSVGGVLARYAYLRACSADVSDAQPLPWGARVSRIVLFASINRGLSVKRHRSIRWAATVGRFLPPLRRLVGWELLSGSDFITNLRIQWIRHFANLKVKPPLVVQLLGTRDSLVSRDDSLDIEQFASGYYTEIPGATHADLHRLGTASDPDGRYALIRDAFVGEVPVRAENLQVVDAPAQVVFVLHGIRANSKTWVKEVKELIDRTWQGVESIGPQYRWFSALEFAIPLTRRRHLRWFQDAYSEALARNPGARFSFIGHSNGTYLFGESLLAIPAMRFERAVLVGSVLPVDFDWSKCARRRQIQELRVDGSSLDWPVGWLCSLLRGLGMKDIGTGGFTGFVDSADVKKHDYFWYKGGHSAPLASTNLPSLAQFAVAGTVVAPLVGSETTWFATVSRALNVLAMPMLVVAVFGLVLLGYYHMFALLVVGALLVVLAMILAFV